MSDTYQLAPGATFTYTHFDEQATVKITEVWVFASSDGTEDNTGLDVNVTYILSGYEYERVDSAEKLARNLAAVGAIQTVCH